MEEIGVVQGAGNSTISNIYTFIDANPLPGGAYYRLKQTDFDGRFEYFDYEYVMCREIQLSQYLANGDYIIKGAPIGAILSIFNSLGQQIHTQGLNSSVVNIPFSTFSKGVYLVNISTSFLNYTEKVLIQ